MTDERERDEIVASTYRALAQETTPAHLDQKILRMASNKAQHPGYARSIKWTRPLAWAATIALCLAITFEVSRGPVPDAIVSESDIAETLPAGRADSAAELFDAESLPPATSLPAAKVEQAKSLAATPSPVAAGNDNAGPVKENEGAALGKRAADEPQRDSFARRKSSDQLASDADDAVASAALEFEIKDQNVLQRAENRARLQNGTISELVAEEESMGRCSEEDQTKPESWLECIQALLDADETAAANREKESLIAVFPDFKLP